MITMKAIATVLIVISATIGFSQSEVDKEGVKKACMNYLEGFYEGDTLKLKESLQPELYKFGFYKGRDSETYNQVSPMTYEGAIAFAKGVKEKGNYPKPDAPKEVEVLDIGNTIAAAKVTAWWGIDYLLLSKREEGWMIEQVLWEGSLERKKAKG